MMTEASAKYLAFSQLFAKAQAAGLTAGVGAKPTAMVVSEAGLFGEKISGGKSWYVAEGACGFAWVTVFPGNCPFANFLKKFGHGSKAYGGGVMIWIGDHGQSVERKERHATAMARVLQEAGLKAYAGSRMD